MRYDFQQPVPKKLDTIHKDLMIVYCFDVIFLHTPTKKYLLLKLVHKLSA